MATNHPSKYIRDPNLRNKFNIIIILIILVLIIGFINFWFSMKIMSSVRAYVGGEGLWSKSEKGAVISLIKYSDSQNPRDYNQYSKYIKVPLGDHLARTELNKEEPDYKVVRKGFIQGEINPSDVNNLIFLYKYFKHEHYMSKAISNWADGDKQIEAIISTAQQIKLTNTNFNQDSSQIIHKQKIDSLLKKVYEADDKATKLENDFSNTLGQGSRTFTTILITVTAILTTLLGILSIFIASLIAKATIKIDRTKSEFVSLASHQLRTPLTAINWYTESLLNLKNIKYSVKQKKLLSELFDATKRSSKLISDLLNVTELDLGTYKFEPQLINIREIIKNVDNDLKQIIKQKKIDLKIYIDRNLPKIKLDERVLTIIIQNLISNSVKYTPKNGSIKVRVTPKKDSILISVSDNGIGIPKDQQSQVFKKLFRADNAKKLDPNNSGLGLYISSSMASKIGGKIWFKSTEEIGSTFYVKLPIEG